MFNKFSAGMIGVKGRKKGGEAKMETGREKDREIKREEKKRYTTVIQNQRQKQE